MNKWLFSIALVLTLASGFTLAGCGEDCPGDEICAFQTFGKDGDFGEECVCVQPECDDDLDCDDGFFCSDGLCVSN